jgi:hypothetical protein
MEIYAVGEMSTLNAFAAHQFSDLTGLPLFKDVYHDDLVSAGRWQYIDKMWEYLGKPSKRPTKIDINMPGIPPVCSEECKYMQSYSAFSLQRNALRMETPSLIAKYRCGWNLKPGHIGGDPLDYAPCSFS